MHVLRNKLILWYSLVSVLCILTINIFLNIYLDKAFRKYAIEQREQQIEKIIHQVNDLYDEETGQYDPTGLNIIGNAALQNGIIIHVQTRARGLNWDIRTHNPLECQNVIQHKKAIMKQESYNIQGRYEERRIDLTNDGIIVGILTVGYYGPYSFNKSEVQLLKTLNCIILIFGLLFLAVSVLIGTLIARHITEPVNKAIAAVNRIAEKEYGIQTNLNNNTLETANLIQAINHMSLALKKEEQQKRQITADVAHELRTPLCNLQSHIEAMIDGIWEPSKTRLESCHTEILRLNKIVDQLRELHLIENDEDYLNKEEFEFSFLCQEIFNEFSLKAKEKEISLQMKMPKDSTIFADRNRIKQCMVNLISNGVWYTPEHGAVEVSLIKKAEETVITVADTGPGIAKEELQNIFERFYRTDKSRNQRTGGMGLGLSITKAIIEAHGGSISVRSQLGKGTEFVITLKGC